METVVTKFDIMQQNAEIRAKREANIKTLNGYLQEARELLTVIPRNTDLETTRERAAVQQRIKSLNALIEDEKRAIESLYDPTEGEISEIVDNLGI